MTFVIRGWICLVLACALMVAGTRSWQRSALGSVRQAHYYYEGSDLKGICVATDDGAIAMLDHKTGEIVWRNYPEEGRRLHRFIPEGRYAALISDNFTKVEVLDLAVGKTLNVIELHKDLHRLAFTDAIIINSSSTNLTYAVMSNKEVRTYEFNKETWSMTAKENETYVFTAYDYERKSVVMAAVLDGQTELKTWPVNGAAKPFSFSFNQYTDILLKTWQYVLVVRMPPYSKQTMIIAHRPDKREMLFNEIEREIGTGFQIKDIVLPSDLVILKSWKEYAIMVIEDLAMKKVQIVSSVEGEYGFGADQTTSRVYMCHSNQYGYKIYEAQPKKAFRVIYSSETELNRRLYGEPEIMWADSVSSLILLRTSDKSLHLIHNKTKLWSKQHGTSKLSRIIPHDDKLIAVSRYSAVFAMDANNGNIEWERSAIGFVGDAFVTERKEGANVALVIDSTDVQKTRIAEVTLAKGGKTEYSQSYKGFSRESSETFKELTNGESKENVLALTGYGGLFNVYPDNEESLKEAREMREKVTYFLLDRRMANLTAHRITPNITSISEIWRINFEKTDEVVLGYRQSKTAGSQREKEVTISGKIFKRFGDLRSVLAVMTMKKAENSLMLHLVNANTGAIIVSKKLAEKMPAKVPLMAFYDNAVIVGLHEGQEKQDSIIVAEICVAQEMANTADETGKTVKKVTDIELIYPIITTVALDWKVFGMEMVRTQDAEYIVTVDQKNNVKAVDTLKLLRGGNQKADAASTKTVDVPDSVIFRAPVAIQYSYKTKNLLIHGMDIYSCEFP